VKQEKGRIVALLKISSLYSPDCREGVFPETGLPMYGIIGNPRTSRPSIKKPLFFGIRAREELGSTPE
jgi:hypothetical protein